MTDSHDANVEPHEHVSPLSTYFGIFGALLVLTVITVGVSYMGLGTASIYVAMIVAIIKAGLVVGYFMHLKWDDPFNRLVFVSSLIFMGIFFVLTGMDVGYRGQINPETDTFVLRNEERGKAEEDKRRAAAEKKEIKLLNQPGSTPNGAEVSPIPPPPAPVVPAAVVPAAVAPAAEPAK